MHVRRSARVVLINDDNEIFLLRHTGKTRVYWVTPGGGLEPDETWEQAAIREMWEETGIDSVELGPCIWTRLGPNHASGAPYASEERYFLVRCGDREISSANQLLHERAHYTASGWWSVPAIRESAETFYPTGLANLLEPVLAGKQPITPLPLPE